MRTVLVTGATSGIGAAAARRLATRLAALVPVVGTPSGRGADAVVRLAADDDVAAATGEYFSGGERTTPSDLARDPEVRERLRAESADLVGVDPDWT